MTAQINEDDLPAFGQARLDVAVLAPKTAALAEVMQHHDRRPCPQDVVLNPHVAPVPWQTSSSIPPARGHFP
jgi:hypothetical protein